MDPSWEIYRFELAYYDARYRRWQRLQENLRVNDEQASSACPHRRQAQQLLQFVRKRITAGKLFGVAPVDGQRPHIVFCKPDRHSEGLLDRLRRIPNIRARWNAILAEFEKAISYNSVEPRHANELRSFFATSFLREIPDTRPAEAFLSVPCALELLTLLPILRHWDLPGFWLRELENKSRTGDDLEKSRSSAEPLSLVEVHYTFPGRSVSPSFMVLGYEMEAEVVSIDTSWGKPQWHARLDYHDSYYCWCPQLHEEDYLYYLVYRFFSDQIEIQLSRLADAETSSQTLMQIAYGVTVPGWRHFLQIFLRPTRPNPASLAEVYSEWNISNRVFATPEVYGFLTESLGRIASTQFQSRVRDAITQRLQASVDQPSKESLYEILGQEASALLPLRSTITCGKIFSYQNCESAVSASGVSSPLPFPVGEVWAPGQMEGRVAASAAGPDQQGCRVPSTTETVSLFEGELQVQLEAQTDQDLWELRVQQTLEQHFQLLTAFTLAQQQQAVIDRRQRMARRSELRAALSTLSPKQVRVLRELVRDGSVTATLPTLHPLFDHKTVLSLMSDCLDPPADQGRMWEQFKMFVAPSVTLQVSEYLGLGPIKRLTHAEAYFYFGKIKDLRIFADELVEKAYHACSVARDSVYRQDLQSLHTIAEQLIAINEALFEGPPRVDESDSIDLNYTTSAQMQIARKRECTFYLVWDQPSASPESLLVPIALNDCKPSGIGLIPQRVEGIELHWPIHKTFGHAFSDLSRLVGRFALRGLYSFGLCTGIPYDAHFVVPEKPPKLWRNYMIVRYWGDGLNRELLERRPPNAFQHFTGEYFQQFGSFYVSVLGSGESSSPAPLYGCRIHNNENETTTRVSLYPVPLNSVFPAECASDRESIIELLLENRVEGDVVLVFAFDSWKHI